MRDLAHGRRFFAIARAPLRPAARSLELARAESERRSGAACSGARTAPRRRRCADAQESRLCGRQLFAKQVPILLQGATGTGKEAFAKSLHRSGLWSDKPFVTVNCAAIPESLIESELFGYTRGAFTGAAKEGRVGKILQSNGGTLFLDEIGDMPLMLQTRLLRVIEEREVVPLGSDQAMPVNLHVISATHRDMRQMIQDGEFREDLYYRLNGITLHLPLLRDRGDKAELIRTLLREENSDQDSIEIDEEAFRKLMEYSWPGNIRQLRNALRTASALCRDGIIRLSNLPQEILDTEIRAAIAPAERRGADAASAAAETCRPRLCARPSARRCCANSKECTGTSAVPRRRWASAATRCTARSTSTTSCSSNSALLTTRRRLTRAAPQPLHIARCELRPSEHPTVWPRALRARPSAADSGSHRVRGPVP